MTEPKDLGKSLQEWWDSDACKQLQQSHKEGVERAVGKYFLLSEEDKLDMIQAICIIICKAEKEGTSHPWQGCRLEGKQACGDTHGGRLVQAC